MMQDGQYTQEELQVSFLIRFNLEMYLLFHFDLANANAIVVDDGVGQLLSC